MRPWSAVWFLAGELVVAAASGRARQELVKGLLLGQERNEREAERWSRHLGLDPAREHFVVALEVPPAQSDVALSRIERYLARNAPGAVATSHSDAVVAIVPRCADSTPPAEQGRKLAQACLAGEGRALVTAAGIGNPCTTTAEIGRSYAEARRALDAARRQGQGGGIAVFAELGIHRLLMQVPDVADLRTFANEVLGCLVEEGRASGIDYLATLSAYFAANSSSARAARGMYLHPNTVSYRIRRAQKFTGLSFSLHRDRLMAEVAVEILLGLDPPSAEVSMLDVRSQGSASTCMLRVSICDPESIATF